MLGIILLVLGSYVWAAIPSSYLVGRYMKGIDIRDYGSGNVGATNVMTHVGRWTGFSLGTWDCLAKGTLPVVLARLLDQSLAVQVGAGLAAIAGHNWSPFIGFTGGRGVATAIGVLLGLLMFWEFLILAVVIGVIGQLMFRESGFWTFISILLLPVLAYLFNRPTEILYMNLGIGALLILKRVTANWEPPGTEYALARVVAYRVLWDRDVPRKAQWTKRGPPPRKESRPGNVGDEVLH
jgi:glycerol-3-phosphate acyltransferase PlsY